MSSLVTPSKSFPFLHCKTLQHSWGATSSMKNNTTESIEAPALMRKKRKRSCSSLRAPKNVEELESQRMVHITVERNRRKQMNEHLTLLRTLVPTSYVQRGDQASIVGATIEFVKELEEILHSLKREKQRREECNSSCIQQEDRCNLLTGSDEGRFSLNPTMSNPWQGFESFVTGISSSSSSLIHSSNNDIISNDNSNIVKYSSVRGNCLARSGLQRHAEHDNNHNCEVEVKVKVVGVEGLLVNVNSPQKMGGKLLQIINALQYSLKLTIYQLNVTTIDNYVHYSFHVQIGAQNQMAQYAHWVEIYLQQIANI